MTQGGTSSDGRPAPRPPGADVAGHARVELLAADQAPLLVRHLFANGDPRVITRVLATIPEVVGRPCPTLGRPWGPGPVARR